VGCQAREAFPPGGIFVVEEMGCQAREHSLQVRVFLGIIPWCAGH
jgi:hypothetical protein